MVKAILFGAVLVRVMHLFFEFATMPFPVLLEQEGKPPIQPTISSQVIEIKAVEAPKTEEPPQQFGHLQGNGWRATSHFREEYCDEKDGYYAWENTLKK